MEEDCPLPRPGQVSTECRDFLARCLVRDPARRATVPELLAHPWVRGAEGGPLQQKALAASLRAFMRGMRGEREAAHDAAWLGVGRFLLALGGAAGDKELAPRLAHACVRMRVGDLFLA